MSHPYYVCLGIEDNDFKIFPCDRNVFFLVTSLLMRNRLTYTSCQGEVGGRATLFFKKEEDADWFHELLKELGVPKTTKPGRQQIKFANDQVWIERITKKVNEGEMEGRNGYRDGCKSLIALLKEIITERETGIKMPIRFDNIKGTLPDIVETKTVRESIEILSKVIEGI